MGSTYKVLAALLSYPTQELQCATAELMAALAGDDRLPPVQRDALERLGAEISQNDLVEYVRTCARRIA